MEKDFELVISEMEWQDVLSTLHDIIADIPNTYPAAAEPQFPSNFDPGATVSHYSDPCFTPEASFNNSNINPSLNHSQQPDAFVHAQHLQLQMPTLPAPPVSHMIPHHLQMPFQQNRVEHLAPPPPPHVIHDPAMKPPGAMNMYPVGFMNGEMIYGIGGPPIFVGPPPQENFKKEHNVQDRPYVKRPPNAFLLFLKEQRPNIVAELKTSNNAVVNATLGQRWKSMTREEQSKYYDQAEKARRLHAQQHPDWTGRDNYGKRRYKRRSKGTMNYFPVIAAK